MNKNYVKGRRLEYDSMRRWKERGYEVARSAGSHSPWDLCAIRACRPVELIQCKVVATQRAANLLLHRHTTRPPMQVSECYHQVLEVKVHGNSTILSITV